MLVLESLGNSKKLECFLKLDKRELIALYGILKSLAHLAIIQRIEKLCWLLVVPILWLHE